MAESKKAGIASVWTTLAGSFQVLLSISLISGLAYVVGRRLLVGPIGNDGPHQLSYVMWLSKYLPDLPDWFPIAGGGYSAVRAYPLFSFYLLAIASRITGLSSLEVFHLGAYLATLVSAFGIYALCSTTLNNRSLGLIASLFYLLSPISWFHAYEHGFVSSILATAPIPFAFISFDQYFRRMLEGRKDTAGRLWLAAFVLLTGLAVMLHLVVGAAVGLAVSLYILLTALGAPPATRSKALKTGARVLLTVAAVLAAILAFWLVPLYVYSAATGQAISVTPQMVAEHKQYFEELVSLTPAGTTKWATNASFPVVIAALAGVGAALGWLYTRKGAALGLVGAAGLFMVASTKVKVAASFLGPFAAYFLGERTLLVAAIVFIPIGAAVGAWTLGGVLTYPVRRVARQLWEGTGTRSRLAAILGKVGWSGAALAIAGLSLYVFRSVSTDDPEHLNYGLERLKGIQVDNIWGTGITQGSLWAELLPGRWPPFQVADDDEALEEARKALSLLPDNQGTRIDISPYIGRLAQNMVVLTDASQVAIYTVSADLIKSMQGYKGNALFSHEPEGAEYAAPIVLNELSEWFGIQYVFIQPEMDPTEHYTAAGWRKIAEASYGSMPIELWSSPRHAELASLTTRPRILVIGSEDTNSYESVFRIGTRGAMPYRDYLLVEGTRPVDEYSAAELSQFDGLFLHGYRYSDSKQAWALLEGYVRDGGSLYVDTGWQWTVPEWEFEVAPAVLPVSRLSWTNYGLTSEFTIGSAEIAGGVDPTRFSPLVWEGLPWGVSGARSEDVREWARVVVSAAGHPVIIAGEHGQGRVVWSGMNLVAHAIDKDNDEEVALLNSLIGWLTEDVRRTDYPVSVERDHPDRVSFAVDVPEGRRVALYWREAYYPAWHAYLVRDEESRQELPIYRAGPGFMLMPFQVDSAGVSIVLQWETPWQERAAALVSLLAAGGLLAYVFDGILSGGQVFNRLSARLQRKRQRTTPSGYVEWLEDSRLQAQDGEPARSPLQEGDGAHEIEPVTNSGSHVTGPEAAQQETATFEALLDRMSVSTSESARDGEASRLIETWRRSRKANGERGGDERA